MVSLTELVAHSNGLVHFTYRADAMQYFRATSKVKGEPKLCELYPNGLVKVSDVVASVNCDQSYEREVMASAIRQGVRADQARELLTFTAQGLSGFRWHPDHVGLVVVNNTTGRLALRAYPSSGTSHYGTHAFYVDVATGREVPETALEHYVGAPKKTSFLVVGGVTLTKADGTPIEKVVPHYYYLAGMEDLRNM